MIRNWINRRFENKVQINENDFGPATCRGNFIGQDNSDQDAKGEIIFTDPNNLPTAIASILNHAQNLADFHPAIQSPDHLAGKLATYINEISKIPFFSEEIHDSIHREYNHGNVNVLIAEIIALYSGFSQKEKDDMVIAISNLAKSTFGNSNSHSFLNLFAALTINASDKENVQIFIFCASIEMMKLKDGKDYVSKQSFRVERNIYHVSHEKIKSHAPELASLLKKSVDEWISGVTSKESQSDKSCFSLIKIKELVNNTTIEETNFRELKLPYPFVLSGNTDKLWSQITGNQWNKMLSKHWIDKGFHFFERIRKRGPEAGINSPSDLETAIRSGKVWHVMNERYMIVLPIINDKGKHFCIFYDYNKDKSRCELVTCSYE